MGNDEAAKVDKSQTQSTDHSAGWGGGRIEKYCLDLEVEAVTRSLGCGSGVWEIWEAEVENGLEAG